MTDRLRETDALPLTPEEVSQYKNWTILGPNFSLSTYEQRRLLATIERQGNALKAVEALAAKLSREDRFAYASDIYDALERDD